MKCEVCSKEFKEYLDQFGKKYKFELTRCKRCLHKYFDQFTPQERKEGWGNERHHIATTR